MRRCAYRGCPEEATHRMVLDIQTDRPNISEYLYCRRHASFAEMDVFLATAIAGTSDRVKASIKKIDPEHLQP